MATLKEIKSAFEQFGNISPITSEVVENYDDRCFLFDFRFYNAPENLRIVRVPVPKAFAHQKLTEEDKSDIVDSGWDHYALSWVTEKEGFRFELSWINVLGIMINVLKISNETEEILWEMCEMKDDPNERCIIVQTSTPDESNPIDSNGWNIKGHTSQRVMWEIDVRVLHSIKTPFVVYCTKQDLNTIRLREALNLLRDN